MLGYGGKQQGKQNRIRSRRILNELHLPMFWLMMKMQRPSVLLKKYVIKENNNRE